MPELVMAIDCSPAGSAIEGNAAADGGTTPNGRGGCTLTSLFVPERPGLGGWATGMYPSAELLNTWAMRRAYLIAVSLLRRAFSAASTQTRFGIEKVA